MRIPNLLATPLRILYLTRTLLPIMKQLPPPHTILKTSKVLKQLSPDRMRKHSSMALMTKLSGMI